MTQISTASWNDAKIEDYDDLTPTVRLFRIRPNRDKTKIFSVGSHIKIAVLINGKVQTRSYSLVGEPVAGFYRIAVKRREDSRGGSEFMWSLRKGSQVQISDPATSFDIDYGHANYLLIAGGIGITPLVGMASNLKRLGKNVRLLYSVRNRAEIAFAAELKSILGDGLSLFVSSEGNRVNLLETFERLPHGTMCAMCGPFSLQRDAQNLWKQAGHRVDLLRWETFGSSGRKPSEPFKVFLPRHDLQINVARNESLLDALTGAGLELLSDCRKGECGLCAMDVISIEGEIDHRDVFLSDLQKNEKTKMCVCVSRASGTLVLDTDYRPDSI